MNKNYDVIIVGSGPAGFSCAMQSAKFDKEVLVIESETDQLGGTWLNTGTVPSKALREAAKTILDFSNQFGEDDQKKPYERFKMGDLLKYKQKILDKENQKVKNDFINNGVDVARGTGRLADEHTVEVDTHTGKTERYTAEYILICTGSTTIRPGNFEVDHTKVLDYSSILELSHIPRRLAIIGSGVNAVEYATTFAALGTRITVLSERDEYLPFLDNEIRDHLKKSFNKKGITIKTGVKVEDVHFNPLRNYTEVRFQSKSGDEQLEVVEAEHALYLGQRKPKIEGLKLGNVGLKTDKHRFLIVNESFQTNIESIYAAGDVIGFPRLASASFTQGRLAACNMFGIPALDVPEQIPFGIYTIPEISNIGITEQEAEKQDLNVTIGRAYFENIAKADMTNHEEGLLKVIFDTDSFELLGVHILGDEAANLVHLGQAIMALEGDVRYFIQHVMNYPTLSEAYRIAAFNGLNKVYENGVDYGNILKNSGKENAG